MSQTSKGDLVRYLYQEMDSLESRALEDAMENNPLLAQEYKELAEAKQMLNGLQERPRHQVLKNILAYAAQTGQPPA